MRHKLLSAAAFALGVVALSGCSTQFYESVDSYTPAIDTSTSTNPAAYHADLAACRQIASRQQEQQKRTRRRELATRVGTGVAVGATLGHLHGNLSGSDKTERDTGVLLAGTFGAAQGLNETRETDDKVHNTPREVLNKCMTNRGHIILN